MPFKFNPFSNNLDYYESPTGVTYYKTRKVVDAGFLLNNEIELDVAPITDSEFVFLNGLILMDDCYTLVGATLTFESGLPFKLGHQLDIRYVA